MHCAFKVLHGSSILKHSDAELCYFLAGKLGTTVMTDDEEAIVQSDLKAIFALEQGVPVAVGSGRSSLKYKVRATAHSVKLGCKTWYRAAEQLHHTATWVGDLGEVGIAQLKTNLKTLMGHWITESDSNSNPVCDDAASEFDAVGQDSRSPSSPKQCVA